MFSTLRVIRLLCMMVELLGKVVPKIEQIYNEYRNLVHISQFVSPPLHTTKLKYINLLQNMTLNFKNNMCAPAVFFGYQICLNTA
jgi:hypothetical protein